MFYLKRVLHGVNTCGGTCNEKSISKSTGPSGKRLQSKLVKETVDENVRKESFQAGHGGRVHRWSCNGR